MPPPKLIQLVMELLKRRDEALTARELARHLLNERLVTGVTLDALADRLVLALEVESQTRGEVARLVKRGDRYTLIDTGVYLAISNQAPEMASVPLSAEVQHTEEKIKDLDLETEREPMVSLHLCEYPLMRQVTALLNLCHGERQSLIDALRRGIRRAAKQEKSERDLLDAEPWIRAHLTGGSATLAKRIWEGSGHLLKPHDFEACWEMIEHYDLMICAEDRCCRINERGLRLLSHEHESRASHSSHHQKSPALLRELDEREGVFALLLICLDHRHLTVDELIQRWGGELRRLGKRRSASWLAIAVSTRLEHLSDRGLVRSEDGQWRLTEEGLSWLRYGGVEAPSADQEAIEQVWGALTRQRAFARASIASLLDSMDPRHFETLVCELLECMGYDEIHLTPSQNDMGVDVIANIELGITSVREVVQVKRQHRAIHRPILDALRGSLHRFDAVRGTLITTSTFSKGTQAAAFERGAAPVTLIDGDRLIDLLMNHEIGVKPIPLKLWQVDPLIFERGSERDWPLWSTSQPLRDKES